MFELTNFLKVSHSEFWNRFNYYGLQSLIVIYLTVAFSLSDDKAYAVYSTYAALSMGFGIIGGIIADRFVGTYMALMMGAVFSLVGNIFLMFSSLSMAYLGISMIIISVGFIRPSTSASIGQIYQHKVDAQSRMIPYFYQIASAGGVVGPLLYGLGLIFHNYAIGFAFSALGMLANILLLAFSLEMKNILHHKQSFYKLFLSLLITLACFSLVYVFLAGMLPLRYLIFPLFLFAIGYVAFIYRKSTAQEKSELKSLLIPVIASIIFVTLFLQLFSSILIFVKLNISVPVLGWHVPPIWFSTLEDLFILLSVPFINKMWRYLTNIGLIKGPESRIFFGLTMSVLSFIVYAIAAMFDTVVLTVGWFALASFLLAIAEISILPTAITCMNKSAPKQYKGSIMGAFYFSLMFSGYLSGVVASLSPRQGELHYHYYEYFLGIGIGVAILVVILKLTSYFIRS